MRYLGGKARLGPKIAAFIELQREKNQLYIEPFLGSAWVFQHIQGKRIGSDLYRPVVSMWQALQDGWCPPYDVTEEDYISAKTTKNLDPKFVSYIGIGCSFGGKLWGGYARDRKTGRNFSHEAFKATLKKAEKLHNTYIDCVSYDEWNPRNCIIYCDPPYEGTESYQGVGGFDHTRFWEIMRQWSLKNTVIISEYKAPSDFKCVLEFLTKNNLALTESKNRTTRTEKVFMYGV